MLDTFQRHGDRPAMTAVPTATGIRDVARLARVSVSTVSNVLNHPELVAEKTRTRVQEAIIALGFVRDDPARQLRAGRSHQIAKER